LSLRGSSLMENMSKPKVFHVITKLEMGGAQGNTLYTCAHLDKERFDVSLVCGEGGIMDGDARAAGYPLHFVPSLTREINPARDAAAFFALRGLFARHKPEIVHTHSSKAGILGRLAAKAAGVPVIVHTFHGFGFTPAQNPALRQSFILAEKKCAEISSALIFVSKANMDEARKLGFPAGNWRLIRSGIDLSEFPPAGFDAAQTRVSLNLSHEARYVVSVGNFKPQKNPQDLIKMAALVAAKIPDVYFVFTGEGELLEQAKRLALRFEITNRCRFPGWRRDVPHILAGASAFALTSLWEGLPRAAVEALRAGVPGAYYDTDGVRDIIADGKNGFLVPRGDYGLAAEKITALLSDKNLHDAVSAAARATDLRDFDIAEMVKSQERLYCELLCI